MDLFCTINRIEVLSEVNKITGYTGKQVEGKFDNIASTEDEENIIGSLYDESILQLFSSFAAYRPSLKSGSIFFDVPETFDISKKQVIEKDIMQFLMNEVCYRWFKITKPDEVDFYSMQGVRILDNIRTLFNMRIIPTKRPVRQMGF
ncbi:hypothetical protein [Parabacteroides sp. AM08-6]|uniref:hypothetical protein n=1 Tax=Parabacteroides sp. AM08-6 TaxID=2292053 RepID=UPI000EFFEDD8|nr:hypothetical protein [Parabacteroides sp. AM08-6]RHJ75757.1 hypothetical protein DW103_17350 [Parabacteroides sp. AM08-6]